MDSKQYKQIHIALVGCASVGKSTLLNAIIGDECSIIKPYTRGTTTMTPRVYRFSEGKFDVKQIRETNQKMDNICNNAKTQNEIKQPTEHLVNHLTVEIDETLNELVIHDIPGLGDPKTQQQTNNYLLNNFYKFDFVVLVMDKNKGLQTTQELDMLKFITKNVSDTNSQGNSIFVIPCLNKLDNAPEEEQNILKKEITDTLNTECKNIVDYMNVLLLMSIKKANIRHHWRTYMDCKLPQTDPLFEEFGMDAHGDCWKTLSPNEKIQKFKDTIKTFSSDETDIDKLFDVIRTRLEKIKVQNVYVRHIFMEVVRKYNANDIRTIDIKQFVAYTEGLASELKTLKTNYPDLEHSKLTCHVDGLVRGLMTRFINNISQQINSLEDIDKTEERYTEVLMLEKVPDNLRSEQTYNQIREMKSQKEKKISDHVQFFFDRLNNSQSTTLDDIMAYQGYIINHPQLNINQDGLYQYLSKFKLTVENIQKILQIYRILMVKDPRRTYDTYYNSIRTMVSDFDTSTLVDLELMILPKYCQNQAIWKPLVRDIKIAIAKRTSLHVQENNTSQFYEQCVNFLEELANKVPPQPFREQPQAGRNDDIKSIDRSNIPVIKLDSSVSGVSKPVSVSPKSPQQVNSQVRQRHQPAYVAINVKN
jgi:GTPase Era involved in 16S rRNA processing